MMLKVSDVSRRLNVSPGCVYELVARGRLPCHRIGLGRGAIRVREEDLNEFLAATRMARGEEAPRLPRPRLKHIRI
jgi:excisionase family DNA binding protein